MVVALSPQDRRKLDELRRIKLLATGSLAFCFGFMVLAKIMEARNPQLAPLIAFAEAATIGGLADWYAVVALFKRPLGLEIPHTEIIPRNQDRIADNLGAFIEENFLDEAVIREKLGEIDFAELLADALADPERAQALSDLVVRLAPRLLEVLDDTDLREVLTGQAVAQLRETDISPVVLKVLGELTEGGRHHRLLNEVVDALHDFLNDEAAVQAIRHRIADELPDVLYIFRADALIVRRILATATQLLREVKEDDGHDLRAEYEAFFRNYVERLRRSRRFARRIEEAKAQILDRPELAELAERLWQGLREAVERDAASDDPALARRLSGLVRDVAEGLRARPDLRAQIDAGVTEAVARLASDQKSAISAFVSDQVKSWDFEQLTLLIEANIGRDLQFIRFNGMIVGGLAGLALYIVESILV